MKNPVELVKQMEKAWVEKDFNLIRSLLHPQYTARCPMGAANSPDEAVNMMKECPFVSHNENSIFVTEGNSVVHIFDWVVETPFKGRIRTAEYVTIKDEKIMAIEMFYDTAALPKEVIEQFNAKKAALV